MIDRGHELPVVRQAALLQVSRSSVYALPRPVPPARLAIMHRIDVLHLEHPFAGSRMLRDLLRAEEVVIGRVAVATLMRRMGIEALYRRPNTSKPAPGGSVAFFAAWRDRGQAGAWHNSGWRKFGRS